MRVALFTTCVADTLFPGAATATVTLLERLGHEVVFNAEQTCCGQVHLNSGYGADAETLARRLTACFAGQELDAIVAPSGSCVAMIREQYPRIAQGSGDHRFRAAVAELTPRTFELSQFLVDELGIVDVGAYYPHSVTYHPTCHSLRALRVGDAPLALLRAVRGLRLIELPQAESCCGFGGTFSVKNSDVSAAMLTDKMRAVLDTGAEVCTALDYSCLMQIGGGLRRQRAGVKVAHLAEILASTEES
ncbi:MAG: (Fe-S)-binding protein [Solirubrobacteraceae bacterium]|jgi:L-lactate dehydrogenase complex protein LldE